MGLNQRRNYHNTSQRLLVGAKPNIKKRPKTTVLHCSAVSMTGKTLNSYKKTVTKKKILLEKNLEQR